MAAMARRRGERVFLPHLYKMYSSPNNTHKAMAAQVKRLDSSVKKLPRYKYLFVRPEDKR
jgi:hypothetical protein